MLAETTIKLRTLAIVAQTAHWFTQGPTFVQDHELFGSIYTKATELLDGVAERAVGLGLDDPSVLSPKAQAQALAAVPDMNYTDADECLVNIMALITAALPDDISDQSVGAQDLLSAMADELEVLLYMISRRLGNTQP